MVSYPNPYVKVIDLALADDLLFQLKAKGFSITHSEHALFHAKNDQVSCVLYKSGKLVVQGKKAPEFIEFFLEPAFILPYESSNELEFHPHIGVDESGKGDFFGPLCVAAVYLEASTCKLLLSKGIKDSKKIQDKEIKKLAAEIKKHCPYQIVKINPAKYNDIYAKFGNLNRLLGWAHATAIEQLVVSTGCRDVLIDQFADESVVETALKRKKIDLKLVQRHRGEEDPSVAAASILAREAFLDGLENLGKPLGLTLPKGCSSIVITAGRKILNEFGVDQLRNLSKEHFKTFKQIVE